MRGDILGWFLTSRASLVFLVRGKHVDYISLRCESYPLYYFICLQKTSHSTADAALFFQPSKVEFEGGKLSHAGGGGRSDIKVSVKKAVTMDVNACSLCGLRRGSRAVLQVVIMKQKLVKKNTCFTHVFITSTQQLFS